MGGYRGGLSRPLPNQDRPAPLSETSSTVKKKRRRAKVASPDFPFGFMSVSCEQLLLISLLCLNFFFFCSSRAQESRAFSLCVRVCVRTCLCLFAEQHHPVFVLFSFMSQSTHTPTMKTFHPTPRFLLLVVVFRILDLESHFTNVLCLECLHVLFVRLIFHALAKWFL